MAKIKEPKKYYCDCQAYCGGILGEVTRGQYRWHEKSRVTDGSSVPPSLRQRRLEAGIDLQPRKRRKRSDDTSTSESAECELESPPSQSTDHLSPGPGTGQDDIGRASSQFPDYPDLGSGSEMQNGSNSQGGLSGTHRYRATVETVDDEEEQPTPGNPTNFDDDDTVLLEEIYSNIKIDDLHVAMEFIGALQSASHDDQGVGLDEQAVRRLRSPPTELPTLDEDLRAAIKLFLGLQHADRDYETTRATFMDLTGRTEFPSLYKVKEAIALLTGIEAVVHDMCVNSCVGFTGPFAELEHCPECRESRWDLDRLRESQGTLKSPRKQFSTILVGPQLQAAFRDPIKAKEMRYRQEYTEKILDKLSRLLDHKQDVYNDFFDGSDYLEAVMAGDIKDDDILLMFSIDGAQLYRNKVSDCWMSIWVVFDRSPEMRYKKEYVLPGVIIPGPSKPKNIDSFLFPGFHHVAAIQHEGLPIWDAAREKHFMSNIFIAIGTSDGPGLAYLNGFVGHHGRNGCRLYCGMPGRHKEGAPIYYPAMLRPTTSVSGSDHCDIDPRHFACSSEMYMQNLAKVLSSRHETHYKQMRLQTGISKPSIFLGFPAGRTLGVPMCFGSDIMHLLSLNLPDLLIPLWRGTLECDAKDSKSSWEWAGLSNLAIWKAHGERVAAAVVDIPGIFGRPPRNPAEKINSGYKAWEYHLYLWGLGPRAESPSNVGHQRQVIPSVTRRDKKARNRSKLPMTITKRSHQLQVLSQHPQAAQCSILRLVVLFLDHPLQNPMPQ